MKWAALIGIWLVCGAVAAVAIFRMPQPSGYVVGSLVVALIGSFIVAWTD